MGAPKQARLAGPKPFRSGEGPRKGEKMTPIFQSEWEGISIALNACNVRLLGVHASACPPRPAGRGGAKAGPAEAGTPNNGRRLSELHARRGP